MMAVKTFPRGACHSEAFRFKDHLNLTDRLEIALEYLKLGGFYGVVTDLADDYNNNRQRIYEKPSAGRGFASIRLSASLRDILKRIQEALLHQKDLYHLMNEISKTTRRLEGRRFAP